ncbi:MAG: 4Fe-4S binding protein [Thermoanaerobaculaceae bacterium]|jgi:Pyruvate/2-oxoacid:ferredoxin oxidoreductase delta subunit|nr:4Fe-4S binding protein [Thermoanaerobaculaceae bacterium]
MAVRTIIRIDEERCDGCGLCATACAEGAIAIVDGKARLVSEVYCDGLGACLGECPQGAITMVEAEAAAFDEQAVAAHLASQGKGHPSPHAAVPVAPALSMPHPAAHAGCPGSRTMSFGAASAEPASEGGSRPSRLGQWPVQLHLLSPAAPYLAGADLLLAADCVAFSVGDFHRDWLAGKALAIACPKLDSNQEVYLDKLVAMIDGARVNTITVMIMEVPCCRGLLQLARTAVARAQRKVPVKAVTIGLQGQVLDQQWV